MSVVMEDRMCLKLIALAEEFYKDTKNIEALNQYRASKCNGQAAQENSSIRREENEQENSSNF